MFLFARHACCVASFVAGVESYLKHCINRNIWLCFASKSTYWLMALLLTSFRCILACFVPSPHDVLVCGASLMKQKSEIRITQLCGCICNVGEVNLLISKTICILFLNTALRFTHLLLWGVTTTRLNIKLFKPLLPICKKFPIFLQCYRRKIIREKTDLEREFVSLIIQKFRFIKTIQMSPSNLHIVRAKETLEIYFILPLTFL